MATKINGHRLEKDEVTGTLTCIQCNKESGSKLAFILKRCPAEGITDQRRSGLEGKKEQHSFYKNGG